jgi:hypothetical protein
MIVGDWSQKQISLTVPASHSATAGKVTIERAGETAPISVDEISILQLPIQAETYWCASDGDLTQDLDSKDSISCTKAGFPWTGNKCCGEETAEYYSQENVIYNLTNAIVTPGTGAVTKEKSANKISFIGPGSITITGPIKVDKKVFGVLNSGTKPDCSNGEILAEQQLDFELMPGKSKTWNISTTNVGDPTSGCTLRRIQLIVVPPAPFGGCWNSTPVDVGEIIEAEARKIASINGNFYGCNLSNAERADINARSGDLITTSDVQAFNKTCNIETSRCGMFSCNPAIVNCEACCPTGYTRTANDYTSVLIQGQINSFDGATLSDTCAKYTWNLKRYRTIGWTTKLQANVSVQCNLPQRNVDSCASFNETRLQYLPWLTCKNLGIWERYPEQAKKSNVTWSDNLQPGEVLSGCCPENMCWWGTDDDAAKPDPGEPWPSINWPGCVDIGTSKTVGDATYVCEP